MGILGFRRAGVEGSHYNMDLKFNVRELEAITLQLP